ncbi:hypothetical protein [Stomatohabitans albus]|uniref:hypothetical protein n=1 Tax=Stomatohabitans albus TaxID=3110766 RepID=UPI00300D48E7
MEDVLHRVAAINPIVVVTNAPIGGGTIALVDIGADEIVTTINVTTVGITVNAMAISVTEVNREIRVVTAGDIEVPVMRLVDHVVTETISGVVTVGGEIVIANRVVTVIIEKVGTPVVMVSSVGDEMIPVAHVVMKADNAAMVTALAEGPVVMASVIPIDNRMHGKVGTALVDSSDAVIFEKPQSNVH